MAQGLKHIEQFLVESKTKEALEGLQEWTRVQYPEKLDEATLQLSRYHMVKNQFGKGLLTLQEHMAEIMKLNSGILLLIEDCKAHLERSSAGSGGSIEGGKAALNEYHSYT